MVTKTNQTCHVTIVHNFQGAAVPVVGAAVVILQVDRVFPALSIVNFAVPPLANTQSVVVQDSDVVVSNKYALFVPEFATNGCTLNLSVAQTTAVIDLPVTVPLVLVCSNDRIFTVSVFVHAIWIDSFSNLRTDHAGVIVHHAVSFSLLLII